MTHTCHWPSCPVEVPPRLWGCRNHWFALPKHLRDKIWDTYRPGQEVDKHPSDEYMDAAEEVQDWIASYVRHNYSEGATMTDSTFDPSQFLDATTTEANTRLPPLPPGDYLATLEDLKLEDWQSKDGQKSGKKFTVQLAVDPSSNMAAVKTGTFEGIKTLRVQDSIMLDSVLKDGKLTMDMGQGKNTGLRWYRDAMNLNVPGQPFAPRMMIGRQLKVKIKHREYQGELFNEVDAVARP